MRAKMIPATALGLAVLGAGCETATRVDDSRPPQAAAAPPVVHEWRDFQMATRSDVWLGGQPSDAALAVFKDSQRGATVINLRTDEEMAADPGYAERVEAMGLRYVHVPVTAETLDRDRYERIAEAVQESPGPVLVHCASGGRATYVWGMHLIEDRGFSAAAASSWCQGRRGKPWEAGDAALAAFAEGPADASPTASPPARSPESPADASVAPEPGAPPIDLDG